MQVVDKVTGNLSTFREQDQSNIAFRKMCKGAVNEIEPPLCRSGPFTSCSIGAVLYVENAIVDWLTSRKRPVKK